MAVLAEIVKSLSEQLQQVQSQLAEQQAINAELQVAITEQQTVITEQARKIDALTKNDVKQDEQVDNLTEAITKQARQVDRLTDNVARLEAQQNVLAALHNGTGCCMSFLLRPFSIDLFSAKYYKFKHIAQSLKFLYFAQCINIDVKCCLV